MSATILVADDDRAIRMVLNQALARLGHDVRMTGNAATLWRWVADGEGDLVITDVIMPDENGLDLIPRIKRVRPDLRVIVMSAQSTLLTAVKATERGAFEYLPKPFDLRELVSVVERALSAPHGRARGAAGGRGRGPAAADRPLAGDAGDLPRHCPADGHRPDGDDHRRERHRQGAGRPRLARFRQAPLGPFVAINMAAIPRELIESELFGHEKGAFTGATARGVGRFEQAKGGTLFLDEIGDMPAEAQTRLLRVLQEGEYTAVGGRTPIRVNVRIIAATHRDLPQLIRQGLFREDLFYRLNVAPIRLPPLRERSSDVPALVRHFASLAAREGLPLKSLDEAAMERLRRYRWPGNVRELENLVRRLAALYSQETIGLDVDRGGAGRGRAGRRAPGRRCRRRRALGRRRAAHPGLFFRASRRPAGRRSL